MSTKTKSPLLSAPVLVVMLALLLAAAGVIYAHWTATLNLEGQVQTGSVAVSWNEAWTNDDGVANDDGEPIEGVWDGTGTSTDPMENAANPARYTKDVGECYANGGGSELNVQLNGVYPSYNCNITGMVTVDGNVPVRATAFDFTGQKVWWNEAGNQVSAPLAVTFEGLEGNFQLGVDAAVHEIEGDIGMGVRCGAQLDPSGCQWLYGYKPISVWNGPVSFDDEGPFADVDGSAIQCEPDSPLAVAKTCWPTDDYQPDGIRNNSDFEVRQECDIAPTEVGGWLHILQPASQNAQYSYTISQDFVNWNEWDAEMCTIGAVVVDPDGTPVGIANGTSTPDLLVP